MAFFAFLVSGDFGIRVELYELVAQADSLRLELLAGYQPAPLVQTDSLTPGGKRLVATDRGAYIAW